MTVNLSIKNVPDDVAEKLRRRAEEHHRSLQRELLATLTESVRPRPALTVQEFLAEARVAGFSTPAESTSIVRRSRESRRGR